MTRPGTIDDTIVLRDVMVPMRDGVRLATDVVLPARDGKPLPGPFPTLLHRTPYDKSAARLSEVSRADPVPKSNLEVAIGLARAGFAVMNQDCRGRYRSEGIFQKYLGEGEDGFDTLEWARGQDWCRGDFGTFGLSYSAHVQTALAIREPVGLKAMFLDSGGFWNAYQGGVRRGGAFEMKQVTWAFKHARLSRAAQDPEVARALDGEDIAAWILGKDWRRGRSPMRHVPDYEDYLFDQWERGAFDAYWQAPELHAEPHYRALARSAVFLVSGWYDPYAETMIRHYQGIRAAGGQAELAMGPWLHGRRSQSFAGEVDFGAASVFDGQIGADYARFRQAWFETWLKPAEAAPTTSRVRWFCMGGGSGAKDAKGRRNHGGSWRSDDQWPPSFTRPETFYLAADQRLERSPAPESSLVLRSDPADPVPTIGGALTSGEPVMEGGAFDQVTRPGTFGARPPFGPLAARPDVLVFATPPLAEDVEIAGPVEVTLDLASDAPDADIAVKLIDWAPPDADWPEGFAMNLTDGILRLRYREDWAAPRLMTPGQRVTVTIPAPPVANLFRAGHRIRLDIAGSNFPKFDVNPQSGEPEARATGARVAQTELFLGGLSGARLVLQVRR